MESEKLIAIVCVALGGIFCLAGAVCNWDFFFNDRKARPIVAIFGRDGARVFYGIVGILFIIFAIALPTLE